MHIYYRCNLNDKPDDCDSVNIIARTIFDT